MNELSMSTPVQPVYQGQFGEFTITADDRREVVIYRGAMAVAALSFALGVAIGLGQETTTTAFHFLTPLYTCFCIALGVSLLTIHIYMGVLHRALQVFWLVGAIAALVISHTDPAPFVVTLYQQPLSLLGIGFTFAALTGIFFKEAFCFDRLETKVLTPLVPLLLLGHLFGFLPVMVEKVLLASWAILFLVFALRKLMQSIPDDIGDKSVFAYLKQQKT